MIFKVYSCDVIKFGQNGVSKRLIGKACVGSQKHSRLTVSKKTVIQRSNFTCQTICCSNNNGIP